MKNKLSALSKEFCVRCHNEWEYSWGNLFAPWNSNDDDCWNRGSVVCPDIHIGDDKETPPKNCPYRLEHMLATQKEPCQNEKEIERTK